MQREIKFRAKPIDSDEWVYGSSPIQLGSKAWAMLTTDEAGRAKLVFVRPETVGQYTGLKAIYEGDILHVESGSTYGDADVRYEEGSFCLKTVTDYTFWFHYLEDDAIIEVVGNLTDNPELLNAPA